MPSKVLPPVLVLVGIAAQACDSSDTGVQAAAPVPPASASFDPRVEPTRVLRSYSWNGDDGVPWLEEGTPARLPFGELGRNSLTGLYCTFNGSLEREGGLQPEGWRLEARGAAPVPGRFGGGLRLASDSVLDATLSPEARALTAWTLEFWFCPTQIGKHDVLEFPGLLRVFIDHESRLAIELPGALPPSESNGSTTLRTGNSRVLEAGTWYHFGLVFDRTVVHGVRMVVDGTPSGIRFDPALVGAMPERFLLGDVLQNRNGLDCVVDELRFLARNTSTEELAEHARLERRTVERLRLTYATGAEELELWTSPQTDARLDTPEEWARGELVNAWASPQGLASTPEHWRELACPDRPVARTTHPVVPIDGRRVLTFGGETRDTHWGLGPNTDDTWIFDGAAESWTRVTTPIAPAPRCHMPAAYSPDHDLVLLVGGWWQGGWWQGAPPETRLDDTWVFHVAERRWEQRFPQGPSPGKISDHGLVYLPEQRRFLLMFGNTARYYDPEADSWSSWQRFEVVNENAQIPAEKLQTSYSIALDPGSGNVLVFGGSHTVGTEEESFVDTTALFDPRTQRLTVLAPAQRPPARVRAALAWDPTHARFVLFGGVRGHRSQRFDDLWTFDPLTREWSEVPRTGPRPAPRGGYFGLAYDEAVGRFVVPCGRREFDRWSDETWTLTLDEGAEGRARYVFDRAELAGGLAWFAEPETPADSAVRFRFRASSDGLRYGEWSETCPEAGRFVQVEVVLVPGASGARPLVRAMGFRAPT
jgi:Kelch motif protein